MTKPCQSNNAMISIDAIPDGSEVEEEEEEGRRRRCWVGGEGFAVRGCGE